MRRFLPGAEDVIANIMGVKHKQEEVLTTPTWASYERCLADPQPHSYLHSVLPKSKIVSDVIVQPFPQAAIIRGSDLQQCIRGLVLQVCHLVGGCGIHLTRPHSII